MSSFDQKARDWDTPERVERPWGWYASVFSTDGHQIKRIGVPSEQPSGGDA